MWKSEEGESSVELEVKAFEKPKDRSNSNNAELERDSVSCILFETERSQSLESEFDEDWRDVSTIELPPERRETASRFLNPCSTLDSTAFSITGSELQTLSFSERHSVISNAATDCPSVVISLASIPIDYPGYGVYSPRNYDSSSNVLKPILRERTPRPVKHIRSASNTLIISGFEHTLPEVHDSAKPGFVISRSISRERPTVEMSEVYNCWSDDEDSEQGLVPMDDPSPKTKVTSFQSRRGSELLPPKEIWITGGPCPGLYVDGGKAHGRPKWVGEEAKVCWNKDAKAWLLTPKNTKDEDAALAMLCVDSNHPCITTRTWRVGRKSSKRIANWFHETYAFKVNREMSCTKYIGNSEKKPEHFLTVDSTLVKVKRGVGIVRFLGPLEDKTGMFAGIELFSPSGLNNGTRKNFFYFEAKPKHGIFVRLPGAVKQIFGSVSDQIATFIDDLLDTARDFRDISDAEVERLIKIIILLQDPRNIFCKSKLKVLGIILFYELMTG